VDHSDWTIVESHDQCTIGGHFGLHARRDGTRGPKNGADRI
jgi:hypothetical protein